MRSILIYFISLLIKLYCKTWRINSNEHFDSYLKRKEQGQYNVFAIWHNQLLALIYFGIRLKPATIASQSKDGDLISEIIENWGYTLARGSSSKGGARGLLKLKKIMNDTKKDAAITVDGPRGPQYEVKPGAVMLAKMTGCPVIPIFFRANRYKQFNSWDRFILPFPFAKVDVFFTEPIYFGNDTSEKSIVKDTEFLNQKMKERQSEICPDFI